MNPVFQAALASILRHVLTGLATYLVTRGIWTSEEATTYVAAAALGVIGLGWGLYQKFRTHDLILNALDATPGTTLDELKGK